MDLTLAIFVVCCVLYLFSGGRFTMVVALAVVAWNLKAGKTLTPTQTSARPLPIYEVDFTHSYATSPQISSTRAQTPPQERPRRVTRRSRTPKVFTSVKNSDKLPESGLAGAAIKLLQSPIYIFYTTLTGLSLRVAKQVCEIISSLGQGSVAPKLVSLDDDVDDLEEYFLKTPKQSNPPIYILVLPSYETDSPIDYFLEHLKDTYQDFRVDKYPLRTLAGFAVLGLGDSEHWAGSKFCYQAELTDKWLGKLGGRRLFPLGKICMKYDGEPKAIEWVNLFNEILFDDEPFYLEQNEEFDDSDAETETTDVLNGVVDVEDMGTIMQQSGNEIQEVKEMVAQDSPTYKSLTKQGYTIVGSHSGVKICRWTKSAMRGRGSCYKYAFYGIRSHLCMETTPSLACANKCVFCWRHGTNPVAKLNWRWQVDPPEQVLSGALEGHYKKIKQMRGIPGVQMERFEEAFQVRHCALSLVGEPIFYPHINEFVAMLHERHISSFLVCNAQHPDNLAALQKVTQLYVSIDAPTKADLKKVDRPLNSDFWERLIACLDILRTTQAHQRTVFRLTLVKGFNMGDVESYADMVVRAKPSQIEVKGATFCGSSTGNGNPLTMQNIPFYDECKTFVESLVAELNRRGESYELAAEHAHSCCILIAHTKFKIGGKWHTHIDYPKFFELLESGQTFNDLDYVKETPAWAVWGSQEAGFNPDDERFDRKADKLRKKQEREAEATTTV